MTTITLTPELEHAIGEQARQVGTTLELLALDKLSDCFLPTMPSPSASDGETMADFLADYIGCIDSGEHVPGGANMSENTGRKFADLLLKKRSDGRG